MDGDGAVDMNDVPISSTAPVLPLSELPRSVKTLLMILSFLDPDHIHVELLKDGAFHVNDPALNFMGGRDRCLYEKKDYSLARSYVDLALERFSNGKPLAYASAVDLRDLINLGLSRPGVALEAFKEAYAIRTDTLPSGDPFLAASQVSLGLAYRELGELDKARDYLQQSIDIRLMHNSDQLENSYGIMANLLLRMGKPDEAEAMLKSCPSLNDFSDETYLKTGNPRFSGDMALLGMIKLAQGRLNEALEFASKALSFRMECLNKPLHVRGSLHQVADLLYRGGNVGQSFKLREDCIKICEELSRDEGIAHLALASYTLSHILRDLGKDNESREYLQKARTLREDRGKLDEE